MIGIFGKIVSERPCASRQSPRARLAVQLAATTVRHHTMGCCGAELGIVVVNKIERRQ